MFNEVFTPNSSANFVSNSPTQLWTSNKKVALNGIFTGICKSAKDVLGHGCALTCDFFSFQKYTLRKYTFEKRYSNTLLKTTLLKIDFQKYALKVHYQKVKFQ